LFLLLFVKILIICAIATGCASFKGGEIPFSKDIEVKSDNEKPSVKIDVKKYFGKPSYSFSQPIEDNNNEIASRIKSTVEKAGLFSNVSSSSHQNTPDYKIEFSIYLFNNGNTAVLAGLITAFSAGLIPVGGTDHYEITCTVTDQRSAKKAEYSNKDHVTTWIGLWFLPMTSHSPEKIENEVIENQIKDILNRMNKDGAINLTRLPR